MMLMDKYLFPLALFSEDRYQQGWCAGDAQGHQSCRFTFKSLSLSPVVVAFSLFCSTISAYIWQVLTPTQDSITGEHSAMAGTSVYPNPPQKISFTLLKCLSVAVSCHT